MMRLWCILRRHPGAYGYRDPHGSAMFCDRCGKTWYEARSS
jgi:hypothetical protein